MKSSLDQRLFWFGDPDEELLLAIAIAVERSIKETVDNVPEVTAHYLSELLEQPGAVHTSLRSEWSSERSVTLALGRLRKRGLVTRSRPYGEGALCWNLTDAGFDLLVERLLFHDAA